MTGRHEQNQQVCIDMEHTNTFLTSGFLQTTLVSTVVSTELQEV